MIIHLESTDAAFERLKLLFESGQVTEISGRRILNISKSGAASPIKSSRQSSVRKNSKSSASVISGSQSGQVNESSRRLMLAVKKSEAQPQNTQSKATRQSRIPSRLNRDVYLSPPSLNSYPFDDSYIERLRHGDTATQEHFVKYFNEVLGIKLRSRRLSAGGLRDVRQETLLRVVLAVRLGEVRVPERLGAFVNVTCNNVLREFYRSSSRKQPADLDEIDVLDVGADLEQRMIADEGAKAVHRVLGKLGKRDITVLRALLQERDKDEICRELKVERGYLRVLTHRAIRNFADQYRAEVTRQVARQVAKKKK